MQTVSKPALATKSLPAQYVLQQRIDIVQQKGLVILLNLFGLALFLIAYLIFNLIIASLRGLQRITIFSISAETSWGWLLFGLLFGLVSLVVLHEAAHGLFFWIYTGNKPLFAFRWTHAYAAAPDWYIRRNAYIVTALAPIFLLSGLGLLVSLFVPQDWLASLVLYISINFASAIGDLYVFYRLLQVPSSTYICDEGDRMTFYVPASSSDPT